MKYIPGTNFKNSKYLINDLNDMMVELRDDGINVHVQPENDIQIKMLSIGRTDILRIRFIHLEKLNREDYMRIYEKVCQISDYMDYNDFSINILLNVEGHYNTKYKDQYERYGLKLNLDELKDFSMRRSLKNIIIGITPKNKVNESLPNQKTVDQLKMVASLSKKTDIGNRLPNENGSNMRYIRNPIDNLESREDYDKKNKDYIPCWNLKHLISPFKGKTKIKKLTESKFELVEFDDEKYISVYGEDIIPDTEFIVYLDQEFNKRYLVRENDINELDKVTFRFDGLAVTRNYYILAMDAKDNYERAKQDADSIRTSDEQYEDPSEWYTREEYEKYYKDGRWSNIFWDYNL